MKRIALVSALALVAASAIPAAIPAAAGPAPHRQNVQAPPSPADRAQARLATITQSVGNLSDDQKAKIQAIYEKAYKQQDDMKAQGKSGEPVRDVLEGADSNAKKILTSAQQDKWPRLRITG